MHEEYWGIGSPRHMTGGGDRIGGVIEEARFADSAMRNGDVTRAFKQAARCRSCIEGFENAEQLWLKHARCRACREPEVGVLRQRFCRYAADARIV